MHLSFSPTTFKAISELFIPHNEDSVLDNKSIIDSHIRILMQTIIGRICPFDLRSTWCVFFSGDIY